MVHLIYCDNVGKKGEREIDKIMSGSKTMIQRGAAGRKIPHSRVYEGEMLYFMEKSSAQISAMATVVAVQNYIKLSEEDINKVFEDNADKLNLTDKQKVRWHKKCLCFVEFTDVLPINPPLAFEHQGNMDDWLILEKIEDVVVGTSVPYNYDNARF